jgi:hypothetical protein
MAVGPLLLCQSRGGALDHAIEHGERIVSQSGISRNLHEVLQNLFVFYAPFVSNRVRARREPVSRHPANPSIHRLDKLDGYSGRTDGGTI